MENLRVSLGKVSIAITRVETTPDEGNMNWMCPTNSSRGGEIRIGLLRVFIEVGGFQCV